MDYSAELWERVLKSLPDNILRTWFDDVQVLDFEDNVLSLYTPPDFKRDIIIKRWVPAICEKLEELVGTICAVEVYSESNIAQSHEKREVSSEGDISNHYEEFVFEHFIVGPSNEFAHAAAQAVADAPAKNYNPLFIYGGSGLGKTHLLYAIMNRIRHNYPHFTINYVSAERFTGDLVTAIRSGRNHELHKRYRNVDILLVDDIQFFSGKEGSQEEFFHTFNALYESHKQIVLTADKAPKDISGIEDRLRSRFEQGLIADILPPTYETRLAIINAKAARLAITIPDEVAYYIAGSLSSNVRQLEGSVKKIKANYELLKEKIDLGLAERIITQMKRENPGLNPTPELILSEVCFYRGLDKSELLGNSRRAEVVMARHIAMYLFRTLLGMSLPEIGSYFKRDHSTVVHAVGKITEQIAIRSQTASDVEFITDIIKNK